MALKPWYKVATPREDLRDGKPLDASEFAVHLHRVKDGSAPEDYSKPDRFFARTFMTRNLKGLASEVVRRLSGNKVQTSPVFNMTTQFGGGKTHSLTLLYHLARGGKNARTWQGVKSILDDAGVDAVPEAATAIFVGTEFDSLAGAGGGDGTPLRRTPWGEIAFQLGDKKGFEAVAKHDEEFIAPSGEVIRRFLPKDRPVLILIDEVINYCSRFRKKGYGDELYKFLHVLSDTVAGLDNAVVVVSVPASELEMTPADWAEQDRFKKVLDRVGKAVMISAEEETSEIIRRRLFEWVGLPSEARPTIREYADWARAHKDQLPGWFPIERAEEVFAATYPFHPSVLSVFERKWQGLPRFQRTRGILRLLALWVTDAYLESYKGAYRDPLITLGTAPLKNPTFRAALFEQLGEEKLEGAVTTDIAGKKDAHAARLDMTSTDTMKKSRLHVKVATSIFFESNGGQTKDAATLPELRLACGEPDLEVGHIENALSALVDACYYLRPDKNLYRFGTKAGLNKILADRQASVDAGRVEERVKQEIQKVFRGDDPVEWRFFPRVSGEVENRAALTLVVLGPDRPASDPATPPFIDQIIREHGTSSRRFKSALIFAACDQVQLMREEAKRLLAWEDINEEKESLDLEEGDKRQIATQLGTARAGLRSAVWNGYQKVMLLDRKNNIQPISLGPSHPSDTTSLTARILEQLERDGIISRAPAATQLTRNWSPTKIEWSTGEVRDAFYSSPIFPRPLTQACLKEMIARGVENGAIGYLVRAADGNVVEYLYQSAMVADNVEFSDQVFVITGKEAERRKEPPRLTSMQIQPAEHILRPGDEFRFAACGFDQNQQPFTIPEPVKWKAEGGSIDDDGTFKAGKKEGAFTISATAGKVGGSARIVVAKEPKKAVVPPPVESFKMVRWEGEIPPLKWMQFYTKLLSGFAAGEGLRITAKVEIAPPGGVSKQKVDELKGSLGELGLGADVRAEE